MFAPEIYIERREKLLKLIPEGGIILLPANHPSPKNYLDNTYEFAPDSTFLYFFGINQPQLVGFLDLDSGEQVLFGDDCSLKDIIWMGAQPSIKDLATSVGVNKSLALSELKNYVKRAQNLNRRVHFLPAYRAEIKMLLASITELNPFTINEFSSVELSLAVVSLREKKTQIEINELEKASQIAYQMQCTAMRMCGVGVKEKDIAVEIEALALKQGSGVSFKSIVSHNGQTLHNVSYDNKLKDGRLLLVDCGALSNEFYASDLTRTMPVNRRFSAQQRDIYNIVYRASSLAFSLSRPEILYQDIHLKVAKQISEDLIELDLMRGNAEDAVQSGAYSLFMPHGLGHMMGMDVHDMENIGENFVGYDKYTQRSKDLGVSSLRLGRRLKQGFVMTVEPGIYFIPDYIKSWKAEGTNKEFINYDKLEDYMDFGGIRLEDDMLITDTSNRMIGNKRAPASIEEIENFMKN